MKPETSQNWTEQDERDFQKALDLAQVARLHVERHDPYTHDHAVRVAQWALLMAKRLPGFDRCRLRKLEISALLHDYGKLMIPASILNKEGPLDEHEWSLVKLHPEIGARTAPVPPKFLSRQAILWHHKKFDGSGYPLGKLKAHRIPVEARITTVADVFDAVTSSRAYRRTTLPPREAIGLLQRLAGKALDPAIVAIFETIYQDTSLRTKGEIGIKTLTIASVISGEVLKARQLLRRHIGDFDPRAPFGRSGPPPGLEDRLVKEMVRANLDSHSARNVVRHVMRLPLKETFRQEDFAMTDDELRQAIQMAGNHQEAVLYVRSSGRKLPYMGIVVFQGHLWLCVGEELGRRSRISLVR